MEVVAIRHAESHGNVARRNGLRRTDMSLLDCGITRKGEAQCREVDGRALACPLVLVSPLTRALTTALRIFKGCGAHIVCHPALREVGTDIPENRPRPLSQVSRDLAHLPGFEDVDFSLLPEDWPRSAAAPIDAFAAFLRELDHPRVAVVSHHNTLQHLLESFGTRIANACPLECLFDGHHLHLRAALSLPQAPVGAGAGDGAAAPTRKLRLALVFRPEQRKNPSIVHAAPSGEGILLAARNKVQKREMRHKGAYVMVRVSDQRKALLRRGDRAAIAWLADGDLLCLTPAAAVANDEAQPLAALAATVDAAVDATAKTTATAAAQQAAEAHHVATEAELSARGAAIVRDATCFARLRGNVLADLRDAIRGNDSFYEKQRGGFVVFDYRSVNARTFQDPSTLATPKERRRARLRLECRGLLVCGRTGRVLARRFHKFFNYGEREETRAARLPPLDDACLLLEKLDGSLASPLLLRGEVRWATKTTIADDVEAFAAERPRLGELAAECLERGVTPLFEWQSPERAVVLAQSRQRLTLLALRHMESGSYASHAEVAAVARRHRCDVARCIALDLAATPSVDDLARGVRRWAPGREGAVLWFPTGHCVKIKSNWYLAAHCLGGEPWQVNKTLLGILERSADDAAAVPHAALLPPALQGRLDDVAASLGARGQLEMAARVGRYAASVADAVRDRARSTGDDRDEVVGGLLRECDRGRSADRVAAALGLPLPQDA